MGATNDPGFPDAAATRRSAPGPCRSIPASPVPLPGAAEIQLAEDRLRASIEPRAAICALTLPMPGGEVGQSVGEQLAASALKGTPDQYKNLERERVQKLGDWLLKTRSVRAFESAISRRIRSFVFLRRNAEMPGWETPILRAILVALTPCTYAACHSGVAVRKAAPPCHLEPSFEV